MSVDPFRRKRACGSCPFRSVAPRRKELPGDGLFSTLTPERVVEIASSLREGAMFPCHKTIDYSQTPDDEGVDVGGRGVGVGEHWCAGALSIILNTGEAWNNPGTRFAAQAGMFDPEAFAGALPALYPTLDAWVAALTDRYERRFQ